jgi:hypothetical protein
LRTFHLRHIHTHAHTKKKPKTITMSRNDTSGFYFQTSDSIASSERKAAKAKNKHGNPIKLPSKILAVANDPFNEGAVYVAEAAGTVKRIVLEVCMPSLPKIGDVWRREC